MYIKEAYKTVSSDFFYTLVDEQYYELWKKKYSKDDIFQKIQEN